METRKIQITIQLDTYNELEKRAKELGITKNKIASEAIDDYLFDLFGFQKQVNNQSETQQSETQQSEMTFADVSMEQKELPHFEAQEIKSVEEIGELFGYTKEQIETVRQEAQIEEKIELEYVIETENQDYGDDTDAFKKQNEDFLKLQDILNESKKDKELNVYVELCENNIIPLITGTLDEKKTLDCFAIAFLLIGIKDEFSHNLHPFGSVVDMA